MKCLDFPDRYRSQDLSLPQVGHLIALTYKENQKDVGRMTRLEKTSSPTG